ncbi:class I SAM-dependent methyltransferase [bacterium]|nr:MAG: class I SAM-dependent methyltransferase [bacterium]
MLDTEFERWSRLFSSPNFHYGYAPGPVARRAVRYHRPLRHCGGTALDVGCGEGQDVAYLVDSHYEVTGLEWTREGIAKTRRLLAEKDRKARLIQEDLRDWHSEESFDLVLSINSLQFLGADAPDELDKVKSLVAPGGVIGLSVFAREDEFENPLEGSIYRWTFDEILANFSDWQPFEAARLWQWGGAGPQPFITLIAARL